MNGAGFRSDITEALGVRICGDARRQGMHVVYPIVAQKISEFVEEINDMLDENFGLRDDDR
jgi:hypothetical protein